MSTTEVKLKYAGRKDLAEALIELMLRTPAFVIREQGHGVRVYCPCGGEHMASFASTPRNEGREVVRVRTFAGRCRQT